MVSFIHNGSEITTWIGYSFKTKRATHCTPTHENSWFYGYTYEKIFSSSFYQRVFLSICWQKSCWFNAKVLPASWGYKPGFYFFSLHEIKMSKQHRFYSLNYLWHIGLMLTISKVFSILCLLCLSWNREYTGSFQNKSLSSSFKWVSKYFLFLAKLKEGGKVGKHRN